MKQTKSSHTFAVTAQRMWWRRGGMQMLGSFRTVVRARQGRARTSWVVTSPVGGVWVPPRNITANPPPVWSPIRGPRHHSTAWIRRVQGPGPRDGAVPGVMSSDHVSVAIHDFGGDGRPALLAHATGFHGYCYLPIADRPSEEFTSYGWTSGGFGDTARPEDWQVEWARYSHDALAAAVPSLPTAGWSGSVTRWAAPASSMAAHRDPGRSISSWRSSRSCCCCEVDPHDGTENFAAVGRRSESRASSDSFDAAVANYSFWGPMMALMPTWSGCTWPTDSDRPPRVSS